ncbi:MAG: BatA domain-containing protein, partial [Candidatus Obscuribacterales bacterium]|nr:BatA domain-containing protein [Steroidobacteraceae bacterium]
MLAPWFLAGLLAIGLPWWLHRLARSETTPQAFPSVMLLERSELRDTRRRQLRYLLLLALRIALIIALALAFTQPQWSVRVPQALASQASFQVIMLDTSVSMRAGTRWQQAKTKAAQLIDATKSNDRLLLIGVAGRKAQVLAGPVAGIERASVRAALETAEPTLERLDLALMALSAKSLVSDDNKNKNLKNDLPLDLHFISDLQQSGSPLRFADLEPPAGARLHLHSVAESAPTSNVSTKASTNASISRVEVSGSEQRTLTVTIAIPGNANESPTAVALQVDDRAIGKAPLKIPAQASSQSENASVALATFTDLKLTPGAHRIHAQLEFASGANDALTDDNTYNAVIEHADPRVLLIARDPRSDEVAYLAAAIEAATAPRLTA